MLAATIVLSACGNDKSQEKPSKGTEMDHSSHSSTGQIPKELKVAENPIYKVGNEVIIKADHMEGMDGAKAKIVGAFVTTAYAVSYTPTTGGVRVTNHKWIIHEEIKKFSKKPYEPGTDVILEAEHMAGMLGATAQIDSAEQTTVYMIDFMPTTGGEKVKNHKWVIEEELSAAK